MLTPGGHLGRLGQFELKEPMSNPPTLSIAKTDNAKPPSSKPFAVRAVEAVVFNVKWVLPLFYLGLSAVLIMYAIAYARQLGNIALHCTTMSMDDMKILTLDAIDIVMIANLVKMIIAGSYNSFISKAHGRANENVSSGTLKVKIATSILIVASIHLLRVMVSHETVSSTEIHDAIFIYLAFLAASVGLGALEYMHHLQEDKHA